MALRRLPHRTTSRLTYRFAQVELLAPCARPETILVLDYVR